MRKKIALIVGHSKSSQGAENEKSNLSEYQFNSALALHVRYQLEKLGFIVTVVYRDSYNALPGEVNDTNADIAVSMHCNAFNNTANGSEVLYYYQSEKGKKLAGYIQKHVVETLDTKDRGLKPCRAAYNGKAGDRGGYLLKYTSMPCVIVEPFFIDNNDALANAMDNFHALSEAYAYGILDYFQQE